LSTRECREEEEEEAEARFNEVMKEIA